MLAMIIPARAFFSLGLEDEATREAYGVEVTGRTKAGVTATILPENVARLRFGAIQEARGIAANPSHDGSHPDRSALLRFAHALEKLGAEAVVFVGVMEGTVRMKAGESRADAIARAQLELQTSLDRHARRFGVMIGLEDPEGNGL